MSPQKHTQKRTQFARKIGWHEKMVTKKLPVGSLVINIFHYCFNFLVTQLDEFLKIYFSAPGFPDEIEKSVIVDT